jgi:hypothetical protein
MTLNGGKTSLKTKTYFNAVFNDVQDLTFNINGKSETDYSILNYLMFCVQSQRLIGLFLNDSQDIKVDNVVNGIELLTNSFQ